MTKHRNRSTTGAVASMLRDSSSISLNTGAERRAIMDRLMRGDISMQDAALEPGVSPVTFGSWLHELGYAERYDARRGRLYRRLRALTPPLGPNDRSATRRRLLAIERCGVRCASSGRALVLVTYAPAGAPPRRRLPSRRRYVGAFFRYKGVSDHFLCFGLRVFPSSLTSSNAASLVGALPTRSPLKWITHGLPNGVTGSRCSTLYPGGSAECLGTISF